MSDKCAYCQCESGLTREHVVPNFIYRRNPQSNFGFNPKADQFVFGDVQIRDVCATCNNEHLGKLDAYASQFYEQNDIGHFVTNEKKVRLVYDYALLSRFLLKVIFNCVRFKGDDTTWIKPFANYILHGIDLPADSDIRLAVEITHCHKIAKAERTLLPQEAKTWSFIPPHSFRIGLLRGIANSRVMVRYVSINNFIFYLIVTTRLNKDFRTALAFFRDELPDATFLDPRAAAVTLKVSSTSALVHYRDTALALEDKWLEYLRRSRARNAN
jgi:hypothetical protein